EVPLGVASGPAVGVMTLDPTSCCVLNNGNGAWAFEALARQLAAALWMDISSSPRQYNYLLHVEDYPIPACNDLFIPFRSVELASDKRLLAEVFSKSGVPTPKPWLVETAEEALAILRTHPGVEWCLKYPLGCGASGHRLLSADLAIHPDWPRPYVVQEFIPLHRPA